MVISDIHRVGKVISARSSDKTARVLFEEIDNLVSNDLNIIQQGGVWMPEVGDIVVCVFLETGSETGFILGKI